MNVIDTVTADQLEEGDYIAVGEYAGEVISLTDGTDGMYVVISDESQYGDRTEILVKYTDLIDLLGA